MQDLYWYSLTLSLHFATLCCLWGNHQGSHKAITPPLKSQNSKESSNFEHQILRMRNTKSLGQNFLLTPKNKGTYLHFHKELIESFIHVSSVTYFYINQLINNSWIKFTWKYIQAYLSFSFKENTSGISLCQESLGNIWTALNTQNNSISQCISQVFNL